MPWNVGRGFYCCESGVCKFWVWDDATPLPALRAQRAALTYGAIDPYAGEDSEEEGSDEDRYDDGEYDAEEDGEEDDGEEEDGDGEVHVDDVLH